MSDAEKYQAILERDPTDTQAFVSLCDIAEKDSDFAYLAELLKYRAQVTKDESEVVDLYYRAGEVYLDKLGNLNAGVEVLLLGFEADPTHGGIGDRLDAVYREAEDWDGALQVAERRIQALEAADSSGTKVTIRSDLHQQAGEILDRALGDSERALAHFRRAIELDKSNLLAIYGAREIYYRDGKYKNAAKLCELEARVEKSSDRRTALYRELAHILGHHLGDAEQAVVALKRALKLDQENDEIKLDLARSIAATAVNAENAKDHRWASDFLLRVARDAEPAESLALARLALLALPESAKAVEFIETKARETGMFDALVAAYEQVVSSLGGLEAQAPMLRRLAKIYLEEVGSPEDALAVAKRLEPLGFEDDARLIATLSKGVRVRASQAPPPPAKITQPAQANVFNAADRGLFAASEGEGEELSVEPEELDADEEEPLDAAPGPASAERRPAAQSAPAAGMSTEEYIEDLHNQAERARRTGDDATAEERMLLVLDHAPHDQKATTYLERRFRARGDWHSLRDLLLKSAGAEHLPPAVQTVRLREAARLSEEQIGDIGGAIESWKLIRENDPKVRDAVDALKRLLADAERWPELIEILDDEAETTKARQKRVEACKRLAEIWHIRMGDAAKAAEYYKKVLELTPEDEEVVSALDELYLREQQYEELVPLLALRAEQARDRATKRAFVLRAAVTLRERLDRPADAYEKAREVLAFSPNDDEALELMESIDEERENWSGYVEVLAQRALAADGSEPRGEFHRKRARVAAHRLGDHRLAVKAWHEVLDALPGDAEALEALCEIHEEQGGWSEIVEVLRLKLATVDNINDRAEVHRRIAHVLEQELGRPEEAMESWRLVLEAGEDVESLGALSRYYERIGDFSELVQVLARQAPHSIDHAERAGILFKRAEILEDKLGERAQAIAGLRQVLVEVDPSHAASLDLLRTILVAEHDYPGAVEILEQQIGYTEDQPRLKELLVLLGSWARDELDDLERAVDAFERALAIDGDDEALVDVLDEAYARLEQWEKLLKLIYGRFQRLGDDREKLEALLRGGRICEEHLSDKNKAWVWYRQAFDNLHHLSETLPVVKEAAHRLELWKELIDVYGAMTRIATEVGEQAEWWLAIADVFETNIDDPAQALEAVLRAFGLDPEEKTLLDRVDRLAVAAKNWQRLATVYGVLASRLTDKDEKTRLLMRYARVLHEEGDQAGAAFDVALKAFELDPHSEELLEAVERIGTAAGRWDDLCKVYNAVAGLREDKQQKAEIKMRAASILREHLDDGDGALTAVLEVVGFDPFSETLRDVAWRMVDELEEALLTSEKGVYWGRIIELYRQLVQVHRHERENQVEVLMTVARVYAEKLADNAAAFECLKEAQQINPRDEATIDRLEEMAGVHDFWEALSDHYSDILDETFEMDVAVMYHRRRARILADQLRRPDDAAEHYWQIIQLDANDEKAYGLLLEHYESCAKWNDLVGLLERQLDATGDEAHKREILLQIAGVWENRIKNRFEAKDWYEQILLRWPGDADAEAGLARLRSGGAAAPVDDTEDEVDDDIRALISIPPPPREKDEDEEPAAEEPEPGDSRPQAHEPEENAPEDGEDEDEDEDEEKDEEEEGGEEEREEPVEPADEESRATPVPTGDDGDGPEPDGEGAPLPAADAEHISFMPAPAEPGAGEQPALSELADDGDALSRGESLFDLDGDGDADDTDAPPLIEEESEMDADDLIVDEESLGSGEQDVTSEIDDDVLEEIDDELLEEEDK
jgi:tetratricopeptide (TPR) repeat protein